MGKSTINGPFSIAMLNYQRVSFNASTLKKSMDNYHISVGSLVKFVSNLYRVRRRGRSGCVRGPKDRVSLMNLS